MKAKTIKWDGRTITKPGIYSGISLSTYHRHDICDGPSISSSGLRAIYGEETSPAKFYSTWSGNPNRIVTPDKRHFIVGRALHHLVLGEPYFAKLFCMQPTEWPDEVGLLRPWNANRKTCQKWLRDRAKEGRIPLTPREVESIKQMAISLGNHPFVRDGALRGYIERSIFWKDKETGIWLKARPDAIPSDSADFTDVKTTRSVTWGALSDTLAKFGYYRQIALVRDACRIVLGMDMSSFTLIFIEKNPPYSTRDVRVQEDDIDLGARENRAALRTFAKCLKENRWPGPGEGNEGNEKIGMTPERRERKAEALRYEYLGDGED